MATIDKREGEFGITYRARVRIQGIPTQVKTFDKLTDAKMWVQQTESAIRRGEFTNVINEAKRHTFNEVIERYKKEILPRKAKTTQVGEKVLMKYWTEQLGEYALSYITQQMIADILSELQSSGNRRNLGPDGKPLDKSKPKSKASMKHYRDYLEQYFNHAMQWGWLGTNPVAKIQKYTKLGNERVRFLSEEERHRLLEACAKSKNKMLFTIVVFALSTGARRGEILNLTLKDIDLQRGQAVLRATKNGETRVIPIVSYLRQIMEDHITRVKALYADLEEKQCKPITPHWLFPGPKRGSAIDFASAFDFARDQAELEDFRFHDLRHCAASYLAMNGATLLEIAAVLGHKTLQMVKRYSHLSENHTASIVTKMNDKIFNLEPPKKDELR